MEVDVVIVGAGPAGLATAIRLKQKSPELGVVVLEKGAEVGAHILSGAVVDPRPLDELLPEWRDEADTPFTTPVREDVFRLLGAKGGVTLPNFMLPALMSNHGNFVVSLGDVCRWLASKAEALGVEIYAGFAAAELLRNADGRVTGVATGDTGSLRDGQPGPAFQRGMALMARQVVLAEGARGSLTKEAISRFGLDSAREPQKYGIGIKELWQVDPMRHRPGRVEHSFGWPLGLSTGGGSFLYHLDNNQVVVGYVVHLNYDNPHLSPFEEFQRFKTHPSVRPTLEGGRRMSYGSRVISEGGWQSVPKLAFPGGILVGDAAGFVNLPRIKGSHNALRSGMLAADHLADALSSGTVDVLDGYDQAWRQSAIGADLRPVRNVKPLWSRFGLLGVAIGGFDMWMQQLLRFSPFGTLGHEGPDHATLKPAARSPAIHYPRPDNVVTFDRLSSVYLSNTNHREDQPVHLVVSDQETQLRSEHDVYGGPSARYCPAGVYEWVEESTGPRFQINAQNCVHCKTCDIKDPNQNIAWTVPEGGDGPNYPNM
jgi:electron-transferring-flavoprotein dehydrogenase